MTDMIPTLAAALAERGYETLTPVQQAVTDPALADADLLVSAQTGSGKTVGFGLAIAHTLLGDAEVMGPAATPLALIVAPTRELAFQVMRELGWLYGKAGAKVTSCVGGMDMRDERRALERGAHIVVGTPGRLRDHIQRGSLDMTTLRAVVLDEADEMLDLGFREDLEFMLSEAPKDRRTLLFSATVPPLIAKLAQQYQRDAVRVQTTTGERQHADISYQALRVAASDGEHAIINMLRYHDATSSIVFANTRAMVARLTARLSNRGLSVVSLSGELSQNERTHALQAMRDGRAQVCVATDVAARGIDLPNLDLVIHAELPSNAEGLLHRSGRTGRAGRKGISALIVPPRDVKKAERLLRFAKIQAEWTVPPSADDILRRDEERLLADPLWEEPVTDEQAAFAAKLLDLHGPDLIAAAYLKLYRARRSAPEELTAPDAKGPPAARQPFGPSVWFRLSVGRDQQAEPRWLLPLVCRAGNIDKTSIGAIRVQQNESFVELSEGAVAGVMAAIGDGTLEDGVTMVKLDNPPEISARRPADNRPERAPDNRPERAPRAKPAYADKPRHDGPAKPRKSFDRAPDAMERAVQDGTVTPYKKPRADGPAKGGYKGDKPKGKPAGAKPYEKREKPFAKSDKPYEKREKPFGKPAGKPAGKSEGKPYAKPEGKSFAKPERPAPRATDTSKRFVPPGGAGAAKPGKPAGKFAGKPGGKPGGKPFAKPGRKPGPGGDSPPRRKD